MAVLCALFATALLMGLGVSVVVLGSAEAALAAHDRTVRALREASMAAAHLAVADLRAQPSWSAVLAPGPVVPLSAAPGRAFDDGAGLTPAPPWGGAALDLQVMSADVSAAADSGVGDPQLWRLYEYGPLQALVPGVAAAPWYVAAWVADDLADGDGDPLTDTNGILAVRAVAYGPADAKVTTAVTVRKTVAAGQPDRVRILTIRPVS
jgi:hypothetical protein